MTTWNLKFDSAKVNELRHKNEKNIPMQWGEIRHCTYEKEVKYMLKYIQNKIRRVNIHLIKKMKKALK